MVGLPTEGCVQHKDGLPASVNGDPVSACAPGLPKGKPEHQFPSARMRQNGQGLREASSFELRFFDNNPPDSREEAK